MHHNYIATTLVEILLKLTERSKLHRSNQELIDYEKILFYAAHRIRRHYSFNCLHCIGPDQIAIGHTGH